MKRHTLEILGRIRGFELEREQLVLRQRYEAEADSASRHHAAQKNLQLSWEPGHALLLADDWMRRETGVRAAFATCETARQRWTAARHERLKQLDRLLLAKQRADIVARLVERQQETEQHEADCGERRELDDLAQSQFTLLERPCP